MRINFLEFMAKHPAIFLDRDGTIIEDKGYLKDPTDIILFPSSIMALKELPEHFLLFIITNQSGISNGNLTHQAMVKSILGVYHLVLRFAKIFQQPFPK